MVIITWVFERNPGAAGFYTRLTRVYSLEQCWAILSLTFYSFIPMLGGSHILEERTMGGSDAKQPGCLIGR